MFLDQGAKVPPNGIPPQPPNLGVEDFPSSFLLLSHLPFFFPSFLSLFFPLFPFFPPSFEAMSGAHHHHIGEDSSLNPFCFSLNPFCFCIHLSKLYICSCNLYRVLVIDNHHTTTPHHRGGSLRSCNTYCHLLFCRGNLSPAVWKILLALGAFGLDAWWQAHI